jgi:hypothetical protein
MIRDEPLCTADFLIGMATVRATARAPAVQFESEGLLVKKEEVKEESATDG